MKILSIICALLLLPSLALADTHTAASCENKTGQLDVQAAVDAATYGDTVSVPAGSCTWDTALSITKGITIQGAGIDTTTIVSTADPFINYTPDATTRTNDNLFTVTGFTFDGNASSTIDAVSVTNSNTTAIRINIHHNKFYRLHRSMSTVGNVFGVFHANTVNTANVLYYLGYEQDSWDNHAVTPGTANILFIENNTITNTNSGGILAGGGHGGGYVFRYNTVTGTSGPSGGAFDIHGNQPGSLHAMQLVEIYNNDLSGFTVPGTAIDHRGGVARIYNNTWKESETFKIREEYCDELDDGTNNENNTTGAICTSCIQHVNSSYYWNNTYSGGTNSAAITQNDCASLQLVENTHFYNSAGTYTIYTCPHPLAGLSGICNSTKGVNGYNVGLVTGVSGMTIGSGATITGVGTGGTITNVQ